MSELKLEVADVTSAQSNKVEMKMENKVVGPALKAEPVKPEESKGFKQRAASGWHIVGDGKDGIVATSNMGDSFKGSVKDFNKAMKVQ
jgi:hypothetical protein